MTDPDVPVGTVFRYLFSLTSSSLIQSVFSPQHSWGPHSGPAEHSRRLCETTERISFPYTYEYSCMYIKGRLDSKLFGKTVALSDLSFDSQYSRYTLTSLFPFEAAPLTYQAHFPNSLRKARWKRCTLDHWTCIDENFFCKYA